MSQDSVNLRFDIVRHGEVVRTEQLDQDVIKIGKLASSHLRLDDPDVSRIHAVIERGADGSLNVIDLGSASGTFVNGQKVTKAKISAEDELQFGETVVRLELVEAAQPDNSTVVANRRSEGAGSMSQQDGQDQPAVHSELASQHGSDGAQIALEDGTVVEPYTQLGYYDEQNNYIPYWYDDQGQYNSGYGYRDEAGAWQVAHGYYDPNGDWIAADEPVGVVGEQQSDSAAPSRPSDSEVYEGEFFDGAGGDTLEVAMLWADHVLSVTSFRAPRDVVTVGASRHNDFVLDDAALGEVSAFPFVACRNGSYFLTFTESMSGFVQNGDDRYTLAEAIDQNVAAKSAMAANAYEVHIGSHSHGRIEIGSTALLVHFTDMPAVIGGGWSIDTDPVPYVTISAVGHILLLFLAMTLPDDAKSLDLDGFQAQDRFVEMMMKPDQEEEKKPDWLGDSGDEEAAAKHKGEEGKAGKEDAEQEDKRMAIKGPPDNENLQLKKARDTKVAMNAGVVKAMNSNQVTSMWGNSNQSIGADATDALGNLQGDSVGTAKGLGGLGVSGSGRGGGGVSEHGIGMANVGTSGRGGGGRGGKGYGKGAGNLGEKDNKMPRVIPGKPAVTGSLDKEIIRRVIRKHRREIAACYQRELQTDKTLAGRIKVKFTISGTGSVIAALKTSSTLNSGAVESCVVSKIRRWVFPEPKGGGIVVVNYPFNFSRQ